MWKIIFAFSFLSLQAGAANVLPWSDAVSAFVWLKIAPDFPVQTVSIGRDEITFRLFDDVYEMTRASHHFLIRRGPELSIVPNETMEKAVHFVKAKKRGDAILPPDAFLQSIRIVEPPSGSVLSRTIHQCKSDLPVRIRVEGLPIDRILKHTWLQNGSEESFGMPFTDSGTYFGGLAHLRTPDSFIARNPRHLECSPVFIPGADSAEPGNSERIACVARSLSMPQEPVFQGGMDDKSWVANLDYQVFDRNCLKAVRFVLACAGAKESQEVNAGIGGAFDWNEIASISPIKPEHRQSILAIRRLLDELRASAAIVDLGAKAEVLLNEAIATDAEIRGEAKGSSIQRSLREICGLARSECDR